MSHRTAASNRLYHTKKLERYALDNQYDGNSPLDARSRDIYNTVFPDEFCQNFPDDQVANRVRADKTKTASFKKWKNPTQR